MKINYYSQIEKRPAETAADNGTKADWTSASQHSSKPMLPAVLMSRPETDNKKRAWTFEKVCVTWKLVENNKIKLFQKPMCPAGENWKKENKVCANRLNLKTAIRLWAVSTERKPETGKDASTFLSEL